MTSFDVLNRWTGEVQFTAEIDCGEDAPRSLSLGLAVKWAIKNGANLSGADLRYANLREADLREANMSGANLREADLREANMSGANLSGADLRYANLREADLREANMSGANLSGANLSDANLRGASLSDANLREALLWGTVGNMREVKSLQLETYAITYTAEMLQIGCERHTIEDWFKFDDARIAAMDEGALEWWNRWRDTLKSIIEMSPAVPTGHTERGQ